MPTVSQLVAASYPAVLNEMRGKPANQWAESACLREFERQKFIKRVSFGTILEHTLDYKRNPGTTTLSTEFQPLSTAKTEVLTAAQFDPATIGVPVTWSKKEEAQNPSEEQKVDLVQSLLTNAITSHDDLIEELIFGATVDGFLGAQTLIPDAGQGSPGGIDASVDAWWRSYSADYNSNGSDMNANLTAAFNSISKGTGGSEPTLIFSGDEPQALYEDGLQDNKRYIDTKEGDAGFKVLAFRTARWIHSQYGGTRIFLASPKALRLNVSKEAFRQKGEVQEFDDAMGYIMKIFSMLQMTTPNKSRLGVITQA